MYFNCDKESIFSLDTIHNRFTQENIYFRPANYIPHYIYCYIISTPIGNMIAAADNDFLYFLQFENQHTSYDNFLTLILSPYNEKFFTAKIGTNDILTQLQTELNLYFAGQLKNFTVPYKFFGTSIQERVWNALSNVSYGTTCSYKDIAIAINNPKGSRAVGGANNKNPICIIVPCHRVIASNGKLTGYAAGLDIKEKLLQLERLHSAL